MKYAIEYVMDGVGYQMELVAKTEETARETCVKSLLQLYPLSVIDIKRVVGVIDEVKEVKEKKVKKKEGSS